MEPTGPTVARQNTTCTDCGDPLPPGRLIRCERCIRAAELACQEIVGRPILPSDIAAIREREG